MLKAVDKEKEKTYVQLGVSSTLYKAQIDGINTTLRQLY
jgi:hypothetical protein